MRSHLWIALALFLTPACGKKSAPVIHAIPADSSAIAVVDLGQLRAAPAYQSLPPSLKSLVQPLDSARELGLSWNGRDLLLITSGAQPPSGYTSIGDGIAAAGPADRIAAARRTLTSGVRNTLQLPSPELRAEIRAALRGDGALPLTGNLMNLANLLRMAEFTTISAHIESAVEIDLSAQCRSIDAAGKMEESLRAMVTLLTAAARDPDVAATLRTVRVTRESMVVRALVQTKPEVIQKAF